MIKRFGGEVCDGERITQIEPGEVVVVRTTKGEYQSRTVVITAGAWASQLLTPLGLKLSLKVRFHTFESPIISKKLSKWYSQNIIPLPTLTREYCNHTRSPRSACCVWHGQSWVRAPNLHQCLQTFLQVCESKRLSCHADLYTVSRCITRGESEDHTREKALKRDPPWL